MHTLLGWHFPLMLAAFLDFAAGICFAALFYQYWLRKDRAYRRWELFIALFMGGCLALMPDLLDLLPQILQGRIEGDHHQLLPHRPWFIFITVMPAMHILMRWDGAKAAWQWTWFAGLCVLWHLLHDTKGLGGGGIAWLAPWRQEYIGLWSLEDPMRALVDNDGWIDKNWRHMSSLALTELFLGSIFLMLASLVLRSRAYAWVGTMITLGVWASAGLIWFIYP